MYTLYGCKFTKKSRNFQMFRDFLLLKKQKKRYFTALNYGLSLPYYDFLTIPDEYTLAGSIDSLAIQVVPGIISSREL